MLHKLLKNAYQDIDAEGWCNNVYCKWIVAHNPELTLKGGVIVIKSGYDIVMQKNTGVVNIIPDNWMVAEEMIRE